MRRNFPWKRRRRWRKALGGLLDIDKRLDSLRQVGKLFPVAHHREHGEHEDEGRGGHDSRRVRYEPLCAGLLVTGSLRCLDSRARFLEVLAQIGFRLGATPLHRDEETRNGTNGSSKTDRLFLFCKSDLNSKLDEL